MKKYIIYLILLIIPINVLALEINSPNYIMYNLTDDQVIIENSSKEQIYVASLTKIATAIVAIENIDNLDESLIIPYEGLEGLVEANASVAGFKLGQTVTYRDLLYGLMLPSGADAAQTLAYEIAGSDEEFVKLMNDLVTKLDLETTNFTNTTGLYNENHYSSVYDIGVILKYALENEDFKTTFTAERYLISDKSITFETSYLSILNYNNLANNFITGAKTGFIDEAGYCLASTATFDEIDFMLITAGAPSAARIPYHVMDALNIYEDIESSYSYINIIKKGDILQYIPTELSTKHQYNIIANEDYDFYINEEMNNSNFNFKYNGEEIINPSTKVGDIGTLDILYNNNIIGQINVEYDGTLEYSMSGLVTIYWQYILGSGFIIIMILVLLIKRAKKRR